MRWTSCTAVVALSLALAIAPNPGIAQKIAAQPQALLGPPRPGQQFVNGGVIARMLVGLHELRRPGIVIDENAQMTVNSRGDAVELIRQRAANILVRFGPPAQLGMEATGNTIPSPAVTMTVRRLDAVYAAENCFSDRSLPGVTDRDLANYDVVINSPTSGPFAGKIVIGMAHHKNSAIKETRAGCEDSSGGFSGGYIVDANTFAVTPKPCS